MAFQCRTQTDRRKVYDCIKAHAEGVKVSDMASELGMPMEEVRGHVTRLRNEGAVQPVGCRRAFVWRVRR